MSAASYDAPAADRAFGPAVGGRCPPRGRAGTHRRRFSPSSGLRIVMVAMGSFLRLSTLRSIRQRRQAT